MVQKLVFLLFIWFPVLGGSGGEPASPGGDIYSVSLVKPQEQFYLAWDRPTGRYLVLLRDSFYCLDPGGHAWIKTPYEVNEFSNDLDFTLLKVLSHPSRTFLALESGGYVYEVRGNSVFRIDRSINQKSQFGSAKFLMGDTLVSFGGYGFWNFQNFFTYLNPMNREWEMFELNADHPLPSGRSYFSWCYDPSTRDFYLMNGINTRFRARKPFEMRTLDDIWKISLDSRKWKKMGRLNKSHPIHYTCPFIEYNGKWLYFYNTFLVEADFRHNRLKKIGFQEHLALDIFREKGLAWNAEKGELLFARSGAANRPDQILVFPIGLFYGKTLVSTWLYRNYTNFFIYGFLVVFAAGGVWLYLRMRKRHREKAGKLLLFSDTGELKFRNIVINLDETERKLLSEMAKDNRYFNTLELFEIIGDGQFSPDALKKQKLKIFNSINNKIGFITQGKTDLFLTRRSAGDKRLTEAKINDGIVRIVK